MKNTKQKHVFCLLSVLLTGILLLAACRGGGGPAGPEQPGPPAQLAQGEVADEQAAPAAEGGGVAQQEEPPLAEEYAGAEWEENEYVSDYQAWEWMDYYNVEELNWDAGYELGIPEFRNSMFRWSPGELVAIEHSGEKLLFEGMPIWNVYLADLTNDGYPEFCATVSFGSGIVDTHVLVYDYAEEELYVLSDRMNYDFSLSLEDGQVVVTRKEYNGDAETSGLLAIVDGELTALGI
jgi:hypothetical protein